jgi:ubiquinone biosynthesis monooxygenase Coq7
MEPRHFTLGDRVISEISKAINVLASTARPGRDYPGAHYEEAPLSGDEKNTAAALMRVNHAGEIAAQALYQGQAFWARKPEIAAELRAAGAEELDHVAWCEQRIRELGGRTSLLNPLWYAGSFAIGATAAAFGDATSLGFITETERQVEAHLHGHLQQLPAADIRTRRIIQTMQEDEIAHGAKATKLGGQPLPGIVGKLMKMTSRLMTKGSFWL